MLQHGCFRRTVQRAAGQHCIFHVFFTVLVPELREDFLPGDLRGIKLHIAVELSIGHVPVLFSQHHGDHRQVVTVLRNSGCQAEKHFLAPFFGPSGFHTVDQDFLIRHILPESV